MSRIARSSRRCVATRSGAVASVGCRTHVRRRGGGARAGARRRPGADPVRRRRGRGRARPAVHAGRLLRGLHRPGRRPRRCACCTSTARSTDAGRRAPARERRRRAGVQPAQRAHRDGHRPGQRGRDPGRRPGRAAGAAPTRPARSRPPSPAPARPTRPRSRRWSPGCCGSTRRRKPADAADALALAICHIWRGGTRAKLEAGRSRRARRGGATMIASVRGSGGRDRAGRRRDRGRRGRAWPCTARPAPSPACGSAPRPGWPPA